MAVLVGVAGIGAVGQLPRACDSGVAFHLRTSLSGDRAAIDQFLADSCPDLELAAAAWALGIDVVAAVVLGVALFIALHALWPHAWRTTLFAERLRSVVFLPLAAAALDVAENFTVLVGLMAGSDDGGLGMAPFAVALAPVFGWWKFLLYALSAVALLAALLGFVGYREMGSLPPMVPAAKAPDDPGQPPKLDGRGISLSGGGIRAASVAFGAMRGLDENGLFRSASYLSAVSGGSYAAVAWRLARSPGDKPPSLPEPTDERDGIFDDVHDDGDDGDDPRNLYEHICTHRRYLTTGRGGLPAAVLAVVATIVFNLALLAVAVYLPAWLLGRLAASPFVLGGDLDGEVWRASLYGPAAAAGIVAALAFLVSLELRPPRQQRLMKVGAAVAGAALVVSLPLVVVPLAITTSPMLADLLQAEDAGWAVRGGVLGLLASLGVGGALVRLAMKPVSKAAPRLGGIALAIAALGFAVWVARDAALQYRTWSSPEVFIAVLVVAGALYLVVNVRSWSPHMLYLARLRSTFATRQKTVAGDAGNAVATDRVVESRAWRDEKHWSGFTDAGGPELLVCAAAQRRDRTGTGVPAVSFVFSPSAVTLYHHRLRPDASLEVVESSVGIERYQQALPGRLERELTKPSAAAAISGAAVTSAMGRHSFGTTNALLAALNVRLGVWLPNPYYLDKNGATVRRFKRTRMNYLVKEIFGHYDLREPFVYVTDGGHWENLGLVELLRRRCETVFCVDASGGAPGNVAALREALVLAEVECGATVDIDIGLERLQPHPQTGVAEDCVAVGVVRHHRRAAHRRHAACLPDECSYGVLFYVKAVVSRYAPDSILTYALQDRRFPDYSTADQFLGRVQFEQLVTLGCSAATRAAMLAEQLEQARAQGAAVADLDEALRPVYARLRSLEAGSRSAPESTGDDAYVASDVGEHTATDAVEDTDTDAVERAVRDADGGAVRAE